MTSLTAYAKTIGRSFRDGNWQTGLGVSKSEAVFLVYQPYPLVQSYKGFWRRLEELTKYSVRLRRLSLFFRIFAIINLIHTRWLLS